MLIRAILIFLTLLNSSLGQERGGAEPRAVLPILSQILGRAGASGSIEYWGQCDFHKPYPDFPAISVILSNKPLSAAENLRKFFASDPWMQVTEEPNGLVRMVESDVPTDLLDVKIKHVSFEDMQGLGGPNNALFRVLSSPEVKAYRRAHNIGPFADGGAFPGDSDSAQRVSGDLYDVTTRQALDYILRFYPGFWIYENCHNDTKDGRDVFLSFVIAYRDSSGRVH